MEKRQIIIVLSLIALVAVGFTVMTALSKNEKKMKSKPPVADKIAFVETVENSTIPIKINASGNLIAKNKLELYTEVQGVLEYTGKEFRPGVTYKKGQTILRINSDEHFASLQSQKSNLQNLIASIIPDIRLDYPESFERWNVYLQNFDLDKNVKTLPEPATDQEKYFITGKNIYTTYFNVKNAEARMEKYNIRAPYSGILTETNVNSGALVRSGQKMGEFIDPTVFELEIAINAAYANVLKVGKEVQLHNVSRTQTWNAKVSRINSRVDSRTQSVSIFVEIKGNNLREGMYLEADVPGSDVENAFEVPRKIMVDNNAVFTVKDNKLVLIKVQVVHFDESTAVIKGLENGTQLVSKMIPGAYEGMVVTLRDELN